MHIELVEYENKNIRRSERKIRFIHRRNNATVRVDLGSDTLQAFGDRIINQRRMASRRKKDAVLINSR